MADYLITIADAARPALRRAVLAALDVATTATRVGQDTDEATLLSAWAEESVPRIAAAVKDMAQQVMGKAGPRTLDQVKTGSSWRYDAVNPRAVAYVEAHAAALVVQINRQQREAVRQAIGRVVGAEISAGQAAKQIRASVGLTSRMEQAVWNYRANAIRGGVSLSKVDRITARYRQTLINRRAETIARTETISALSAGRVEAWQQAMETGLLPATSQKKWIVTPDDRLCPTCAAMVGERVEMGETFTGGVEYPPRHPRCRCAITIVRGQAAPIRMVRTERVPVLR